MGIVAKAGFWIGLVGIVVSVFSVSPARNPVPFILLAAMTLPYIYQQFAAGAADAEGAEKSPAE